MYRSGGGGGGGGGTEFPREVGPPDRKFGGTEFPVTPDEQWSDFGDELRILAGRLLVFGRNYTSRVSFYLRVLVPAV